MRDGILQDVQNPAFRSLLDLFRWMAALMVLAGHLRHHVLVNPGDAADGSIGPLAQLFYALTGFGFEALAMFVVLSGFLVGGLGVAKSRAGRFSLGGFTLDRVTRLYVAFLPAVLLCWGLDCWASGHFADLGLYDKTHPLMADREFQYAYERGLGGHVVAGNLAMLQYFFFRPVGSNIPLWYLSVEFWLYVVFACGVIAIIGPSWLRRALALPLGVAIVYILGYRLVAWMIMWIFGLLAALPGGRPLRRPILSLIVLAAALVTARVLHRVEAPSVTQWLTWKYLPPAAFAYCIFSMRGVRWGLLERLRPLNEKMASFSFSLYLIHYPIMIAAIGVAWKHLGVTGLSQGYQPNDPEWVLVYAAIFAVAIALSIGFAWCTERHTARVKAWIGTRVLRRRGG